MTVDEARRWLIIASLTVTGSQMIFLVLAPIFGYPLEWSKSLDSMRIITPVFLGYLGSAAHFIFMTPSPVVVANNAFLGIMLKGPMIIYVAVVVSGFVAFGWSNRVDAVPGTGMSLDNLTNIMTAALGVLAVTTGVISAYLFAVNSREQPKPPKED